MEILSGRVFNALFKLAEKHPGRASSSALSDLTQIRQFLTGNGMFAFLIAPLVTCYISGVLLFLFHPILLGYLLAIFSRDNTL